MTAARDLAKLAPLPTVSGQFIYDQASASWLQVTKSMVGLSNADNTSDATKPVSGPQQAALDLKAPLSNPNFTGNMSVSGVLTARSTIELGDTSGTGAPTYIDFHCGVTPVDRDGRILCQNGTGANDGGEMRISAASVTLVGLAQTTGELRVAGTSQILAGTLTVAGDITASRASGNTSINMNGPAGAQKRLAVYTALSARWTIGGSNAAETGSNAGTDFTIGRFSDAGAGLSNPLTINRATGLTTLESLSVTGQITGLGDVVAASPTDPKFRVTGPAGTTRRLRFDTANVARFEFAMGTAAESGSNAGSNFALNRFADDGSALGTIMSVDRASGDSIFFGKVTTQAPFKFGAYTLTTLPSASLYSGYLIEVSNATGGPKTCRSNGTVWQILNTTTTVS